MTVRRPTFAVLTLAITLAGAVHAGTTKTPWHASRQLVLVTTTDWNIDHGTLRTYTRGEHGWVATGVSVPVTIGKNGAGWGLGLNAPQSGGPVKHEGDNRSPAGVFRIGDTFGYAEKIYTAMPYLALNATQYCVDVSGAKHYNRIVDANVVGAAAVKGSTEPMRRDLHANGDQRYRMGFVIEQNPQAKPQAGSCIFGHLWKSPTDATAGCTAMTPAVMQSLLAWLRPEDQPVFILLPQHEYERLRTTWQLPAIAAPGGAR
ncbi:L,D-transpeptidase family protein [Rhodanobacter sp. Col0626]|uniref:L,D-transpeptidase family protein n=1 Tax=Rhodanobacter sp. Col0626 TaxID=3415679 RepID=UPI003CF2D217